MFNIALPLQMDMSRRTFIHASVAAATDGTAADRLNPTLNAYITVKDDLAMKSAQEAESEIQQQSPARTYPRCSDCAQTTAASALFKDRVAVQDAGVARRLKTAGAVLVGKSSRYEFAYGGSSAVSYFRAVHHKSPDRHANLRTAWTRCACAATAQAYEQAGTS